MRKKVLATVCAVLTVVAVMGLVPLAGAGGAIPPHPMS